jgi:PleD family two-component response regulator
MMSADSTSTRVKIKDDSKKLTKVLSTKLSMEDYNVFRILTNQAYRSGVISEDSPSEMLRYMITPLVDGFRKIPGFLLLYYKTR